MWLFALFVAVPLIEIALFISVGGAIGLFPTLAIVVLTAVIGTWLVRSQGLQALARLRSSFEELRDPTGALAHGAMILFSGALLLTPGFFTDTVGFLLLIPGVREALWRAIAARVEVRSFTVGGAEMRKPRAAPPGRGPVIDGEFEDLDGAGGPPRGPSGWTRH